MNITKWFFISIIALFLCACADSNQMVRQNTSKVTKLSPSDAIYIAVSRDGRYGERTYEGSGLMTSQILSAAFAKRASVVEVGVVYQRHEEALRAAKDMKYPYLVYPTILHWEDRATEWSGIPDKVEVKVQLINVQAGLPVDTVIIKGRSGWATLGGDHPQDLLPEPVEKFVSSLY